MSKSTKIIKAYQFFVEAEQNKSSFTLDDVVAATGWAIQTVKAYKSKKWHTFLVETEDGFVCEGMSHLSEDAFIRIHAQRATIEDNLLRPRFSPDVDALIDKSRESALLAVQIYNNPIIQFRAPGYIVNMIIAYTALFHALFDRQGIDYWYKEEDGSPKMADNDYRYWELSKCVKEYFKDNQTAETENLRFFINLRNKIEHRFVPALDLSISGYCQALLLNFEKILVKEFGGYFALGQNSLALALQLSEYSTHQQEALKNIQSQHLNSITDYIVEFRNNLPDTILTSGNFCFRAFLIPILGNHAKSSDIAVEFVKFDPKSPEEMGKYEKQIAFIKQKQVIVYQNVRTHHVFEAFLNRENVSEPETYIKAILFEQATYLPIYYFAYLGKLTKPQVLQIIENSPNAKQYQKTSLLKRLEEDETGVNYYKLPKKDASIQQRKIFLDQIIDQSFSVEDNYEPVHVLQAIQLMEKDHIDPDYIFPILSKFREKYRLDKRVKSVLSKAICYVDYVLYGSVHEN